MLKFLGHEKYSCLIYINTNNKNKEIQISEEKKTQIKITNTEIQKKHNLRNTGIKVTFELWVTFELCLTPEVGCLKLVNESLRIFVAQ